ncbi:Hypothetical predicted protein [Octopus vulgaris]|uniref:Uncharacterized protein n=1 Tax=Octopus vulgaris TaxID=6645 RepID=A0AA36B094_OCTVU|nr:Hypothetical predicted protein [Octopus vulgaris]
MPPVLVSVVAANTPPCIWGNRPSSADRFHRSSTLASCPPQPRVLCRQGPSVAAVYADPSNVTTFEEIVDVPVSESYFSVVLLGCISVSVSLATDWV